MRLELHVFLWVTVGILILFQFSGGIAQPEKVESDKLPMRAQLIGAGEDISEAGAGDIRLAIRQKLIEYDRSVRKMFSVIEMTVPSPQQEFVSTDAAALPLLKGVLGRGTGRKAVFAPTPGAADYVTVGVGEVIADYRVQAIGEDVVTAVSLAGEEVRFKLRGAGEGD